MVTQEINVGFDWICSDGAIVVKLHLILTVSFRTLAIEVTVLGATCKRLEFLADGEHLAGWPEWDPTSQILARHFVKIASEHDWLLAEIRQAVAAQLARDALEGE